MHGLLGLHDATLLDIRVDWGQAECAFRMVRIGSGLGELVFTGLRELHVPRENAWGPSNFVYEFNQVAPEVFEVQMQSGDLVKISATSFRFDEGVEEVRGD